MGSLKTLTNPDPQLHG